MSLYRLIFIWYGSSARQNQILQIVKHFDIDLTCNVIGDPEVKNIRFSPQIFQIYIQTSFEFCKSEQ